MLINNNQASPRTARAGLGQSYREYMHDLTRASSSEGSIKLALDKVRSSARVKDKETARFWAQTARELGACEPEIEEAYGIRL